jgi:hypothetical protein
MNSSGLIGYTFHNFTEKSNGENPFAEFLFPQEDDKNILI